MQIRKTLTAGLFLAMLTCWSAPLSFAASSSGSRTAAGRADPQNHSCCPGLHPNSTTLHFVLLSDVPARPCGDRHPCCAQRGPENVPEVAASTQVKPSHARASLSRAGVQDMSPWPELRTAASARDISPASLRSTVLRI